MASHEILLLRFNAWFACIEKVCAAIQPSPMLRHTTRTVHVARRAAAATQRAHPVLFQRRLISSDEMFEAFGNPTPPSESNSKSGSRSGASSGVSKSSSNSTFTAPAKKIDPVININRDFSSSAGESPSNSNRDATTISDVFKGSLNDFDAVQKQEVYDQTTKNWSESFHGLGNAPFSKDAQDILYCELPDDDIEITPDGLLYLPEIKYRRILNKAFGAGAWGLAPRSETLVQMQENGGLLTREYGLVIHGRLVSIARGEQTFFKESGIPTATEGCKSNALMRCCKDLGIASELWDPRFIKKFKKSNCENIFVEYVPTKKKKKIWKRKDEDVEYPFKR